MGSKFYLDYAMITTPTNIDIFPFKVMPGFYPRDTQFYQVFTRSS